MPKRSQAEVERRRKQLARLLRKGWWTHDQLAAATENSRRTVQRYLSDMPVISRTAANGFNEYTIPEELKKWQSV